MITLRKAYPTDAYELVRIRDLAWKDSYYDVLSNEIINIMNKNIEESIRHLQDQIQENNRIVVALDGDKIVGFVFYAKTQGENYDNAEIREIYVLPEFQRNGIGKQLFNEAVDNLRKLSYSSFIVSVPIYNKNMDFFVKMGGIKKGNRHTEMYGHPFDCEVIYFDIAKSDKNGAQSDWNELYLKAQDQLFLLNDLNPEVAILLSSSGNMYMGLGIKNKVCPIESALSNMYLGGENKIVKILILNKQSKPVLPCGKCRDLLIHLGQEQASILFDFGSFKTMTMKELNPYYKNEEKS